MSNNEQVVVQDQSQQIIALQSTVSEQLTMLTNQYNAYQAELDAMEERLYEIDRENHCPICYAPWMDQGPHRMVSLRCGHLYGDECIRMWLEERSHCPFCRDPVNIMDLRYIVGRRILPRLQQDQLQLLQLRGASSVEHALYNFQQLTRSFMGVLRIAEERPLPGHPQTVVQQNLQAMQQVLSAVEQVTGRLFLVLQLPPPDGPEDAPSVQLHVVEEDAQIIAQEAANVTEEAQRIISSVSPGQRQDPAVPYQAELPNPVIPIRPMAPEQAELLHPVIRIPRYGGDLNQALPAPAAQMPLIGNGSRRRPRVPSPEVQAPDEQQNGGRRRRRIRGPPPEDNQAPDEHGNGRRRRRRRIRGPPPEDYQVSDEEDNGRRRRRIRGTLRIGPSC